MARFSGTGESVSSPPREDERFARLPDLVFLKGESWTPKMRFKTRQMLLIYPHEIKRVKHVFFFCFFLKKCLFMWRLLHW